MLDYRVVRRGSYAFGESVRVDTKTIRMLKVNWSSSVTKQEHQEVNSFLVVVEVIPKHYNTWSQLLRNYMHFIRHPSSSQRELYSSQVA